MDFAPKIFDEFSSKTRKFFLIYGGPLTGLRQDYSNRYETHKQEVYSEQLTVNSKL
jgi:hypothetical protein